MSERKTLGFELWESFDKGKTWERLFSGGSIRLLNEELDALRQQPRNKAKHYKIMEIERLISERVYSSP